jgi:hypothetical protein
MVLGCGPAGLMAAWAFKREGFDVTIRSRPVKSQFAGAQYLHNMIPGITPEEPNIEVDFIKLGLAGVYRQKAHGEVKGIKSSWHTMPTGLVEGWSLRAAYDLLWMELHELIEDTELDPDKVMKYTFDYDVVASSVNLESLCYQHHLFTSEHHFIVPAAEHVIPPSTVIYNGYPVEEGPDGDLVNWWHRGSNIDGTAFLETTSLPKHYKGTPITVKKPISTNCTCYPQKFVKVGRFGKWDKTALADSAFWDIYNKLSGV